MGSMKTPGVYIVEKNAFPNSVVEAPTAIPAFIGITEKAMNGNDDLKNKPWKISSMTEFIKYFGGAPELSFTVDIKRYNPDATTKNGKVVPENAVLNPESKVFQYDVKSEEKNKFPIIPKPATEPFEKDYAVNYAFYINGENKYTLYYNMSLFFANGGGTCYIVSVGTYGKDTLDDTKVTTALTNLEKEQEITMIIVPEAVENTGVCTNIQQNMLKHCGEMANRFTILDIAPKYPNNDQLNTRMEIFQGSIGSEYMSYGAAYYPWLNTSVLGDRDIDGEMFTWSETFYTYRDKFSDVDRNLQAIIEKFMFQSIEVEKDKKVTIRGKEYAYDIITKELLEKDLGEGMIATVETISAVDPTPEKKVITFSSRYVTDKNGFHQALFNGSVLYQYAMKGLKKYLNLLPPSAAMAGIYTRVDNTRGVWKAPANVSVSYVESTAENIDDKEQEDLNAPMNGKAINVIRTFQGEGIKVWGARTLDGNSLDWRYINVRRTLLFLEESVKNAARAYVFEPNDAGTWINMKSMIENFLRGIW
ncbi:phage tail sheath subtilisin-like domain-containing protein, partial [uncultured Parabacteroides sp.]|uniref:phage tail sheath family protein n=1 Tax=uncultured Parabacteroides sp. TaxID=512312 RepID=UPI00259544C2